MDASSARATGHAWSLFLTAPEREFERSRDWPGDRFPHFTENARWRLLPVHAMSGWRSDDAYEHGNWTAGFWFGVMWLLGLGIGNAAIPALARTRLDALAARAADTTTHDLGFLFFPSFILGHRTGFLSQTDIAIPMQAARTTASRFNPRGDYIQAFGPIGDHRSAGTSTIDTMVNLPLLWWAGRNGDPILLDIARRHARTSARLFIREDGSTYHLNRFDPLSGALAYRGTFQGASDGSCWSRGQAWAVCGFAWAYAATGEPEFLSAATRTSAYFWNRLPPSGVPPWDFADTSPAAEQDASASAIAALGALILGSTHSETEERGRFWAQGVELLGKLAACINDTEGTEGILLRSCYSKPHGLGLTGATGWGDFFFGAALALASGVVAIDTLLGFELPAVHAREIMESHR